MVQIFSPNQRVPSNLTPDGKFKLAARSIAVIRRVVEISPHQAFCIIENRASPIGGNGETHPGKIGIQLCHTFGRANALDEDKMTSIEYHLGMEHKSLNIDSRWNCFLAINNFHAMFDNGMWCLLPQPEILERYDDATTKDGASYGAHLREAMKEDDISVDDAPSKHHIYTFLALDPDMVVVPIYRHRDMIPGVSAGKVKRILFPYNKPKPLLITSRLHPKFVILNLGDKLKNVITTGMRDQPHVKPFDSDLTKVEDLFTRWTERITPEQEAEMDVIDPQPRARQKTFDDKSYYGSGLLKTSRSCNALKTRHSTRHLKQPAGGSKPATAPLEADEVFSTPMASKIRRTQSTGLFVRLSNRVPLVPANWNDDDVVHDPSDDEDKRRAKSKGGENAYKGKKIGRGPEQKLKRRASPTPVSPSPLDKKARVDTTCDSSDSSDYSDLGL